MAKLRLHPLDRVSLALMLGLTLLIAILIGLGDHTVPLVREFSWDNRQIGSEDRAFTLTFNRPMNWDQVQQYLSIQPNLDGKVSWSGRRLAYTLADPIPYGQSFEIKLDQVEEQLRTTSRKPKPMQPFQSQFQSRDRAFAYIGTDADETGRLLLYNLSQDKKTILTPPNLEVSDFKPFPYGDRILIAATEKEPGAESILNPQLYTVSTGQQVIPPDGEVSQDQAGTMKKILDNQNYQILKFDLSPDGKKIVVQRALRSESGALGQVSMWQMPLGGGLTQIETDSGGEFQIAPDGQTLVMAQGQGLGLIPLKDQETQSPLDFLPEFGSLLSFSQDGTAAATIKFNNDFTRSLFLVTTQGTQTELLRIEGGIMDAKFDPLKKNLYCLLTRVEESDEEYREEPYLAVINIATKALTPILDFSQQPNINISLAPDGTSLLFDQIFDFSQTSGSGESSSQLTASNLWSLPLDVSKSQPIKITNGAMPQWLP